MRYAIVIEKADGDCSAYVPDLPGCIATGATVEEAEAEIREAIIFHVEGLREDGLAVPPGETRLLAGVTPVRVLVQASELAAWCLVHGKVNDAAARAQFVSEKMGRRPDAEA